MSENTRFRFNRKVIATRRPDFEFLDELPGRFKNSFSMIFSSQGSVGIDLLPYYELEKTGLDFNWLTGNVSYDEATLAVRSWLGWQAIPSIDRFMDNVPLDQVDVFPHGPGRRAVGALIPYDHELYEERAAVRAAIEYKQGRKILWDESEIFLNAFEVIERSGTPQDELENVLDEVSDVLSDGLPEYTSIYDLRLRRTA